MSLLVWLPLTQDLKNNGINNITITNSGAILDNNGKLGKCYSFNGTSSVLHSNDIGLDTSKDYTLACWFYLNTIPTGTNARLVQISVDSDTAFGNTNTGIVIDYLNNGSQGKFALLDGGSVAYYNYNFIANTWYHVVYTKQDNTKKIYLNGELLTTLTFGSSNRSSKHFYVGGTGVANRMLNGKLNDVRVYNHTLSEKEIKELSKGLVCHYPLNNNGGGQPNLYNFESVASKWKVTTDTELTLVDATDDVYGNVLKMTSPSSVSSARIYRGVNNVWEADTNFTVSFLAKASKTAVLKIERSRTDYAPDVTVGTTWKRYSTVISCTATTTGGALGIQTSTASADIYITQIKLELGDKATVYCPGVGDSHYIPLGYDSATEYDVSGYGNNGTKNGTIEYLTDTARYNVSTLFADGLSGKITAPITIGDGTQITISVWMKSVDGSGGTGSYHMPININSSEFEFSIPTTGKFRQGFVISGSRKVADYGSTNLLDKKWHMISATFDGTNIKRYIDGVLVDTTAASGTLSTGNKNIYIGTYGGSTQYASKNILESDLRIYATALSAEDIKELYSTAATIDKSGNIYSYEFKEV